MRFRFLLKFLALSVVVMFRQACAEDSASQDALAIEMKIMAKDFASIVDKKGGGAVAIGEFSGSSDIRASVGPRIQLVLAAELKALKVAINPDDYRFEIKGDYQPLTDKETGVLGVRLVGRLIDRDTGEPLVERPSGRFVFGAQTVPAMLGLNTRTPPNAEPQDLSKEFERARKDPRADVQGTIIRSKAGSPFAIEILVKSNGKYVPKSVTADDKGRPFVPINKLDVYGVRLINNSAHEAAVDLQIDGINCFEFSEEKSQYWIIDAGKHVDIIGWHKNNKKSLEFKVVDFPETAAAKLNIKPSATIGLITACFSASWATDAGRPADEPKVDGRGTGFGSEIEVKTEQVKRTIGQVRDTISVRYER